ncbi:MobA-like NTP transferase domain containing protein [Brevibacterium linens]|uniref:MobA-like NTP transferase domain containing protein n=2 Tax=Brevibacterium linens TaxID=1703 RepID=A0A0B9APU5_BRELN|nr:MobA-like NTP transferase domain containing protein [Brevibacterium linens]
MPYSTDSRNAYDRGMQLSAVILSGGRSSRFGGTHKPGVELDGTPVIARILSAVVEAAPEADIWVAGETDGLSEADRERAKAVREEPKFGGPLAGIAAAVDGIDESGAGPEEPAVTLIVAGDMPLVTSAHLRDLIAACAQSGAPAVGYDDRGSMQFLCAAWPGSLLRRRLQEIGDPTDRAVKLLYRDLDTVRVDVDPGQLLDFDTPEEFDRVRSRLAQGAAPSEGRASRPVPEAVEHLRAQVSGGAGAAAGGGAGWGELSAADAAAVLDFASRIKHSDSSLSPVLAAFLAGAVHARDGQGGSVSEALAAVEAVLRSES